MTGSSPDDPQAIDDFMEIMRAGYVNTLRTRLETLDALASGSLDNAERLRLRNEAHALAGSGGLYGYPEISEAGRALEEQLIDYPDAPPDDFAPYIADLRAALHGVIVAAKPQPDAFVGVAEAPAGEGGPRPKVIIVDDDESVRTLLSTLLRADADVIEAPDSESGFDLIARHRPDLALVDNGTSGATGVRLVERLQADADLKTIPVIMITASNRAEDVMRGLMAGASDYVTKPFDLNEVTSKIRSRLQRLNSHILVAEDDPAVRDMLVHKLRSAGCRVTAVADGQAAWEALDHADYALALFDRMMPGYDGVTLLRMMQAKPRVAKVPVVFLTARHYGADILEGLNTGAADYIVKPFNPDEVLARVLRLLKTPLQKETQA